MKSVMDENSTNQPTSAILPNESVMAGTAVAKI